MATGGGPRERHRAVVDFVLRGPTGAGFGLHLAGLPVRDHPLVHRRRAAGTGRAQHLDPRPGGVPFSRAHPGHGGGNGGYVPGCPARSRCSHRPRPHHRRRERFRLRAFEGAGRRQPVRRDRGVPEHTQLRAGGQPAKPLRDPAPRFPVHVRDLCHRIVQSVRPRRRPIGCRSSGPLVQPPVHLRRRRLGQDPPAPRHRQLRNARTSTGATCATYPPRPS